MIVYTHTDIDFVIHSNYILDSFSADVLEKQCNTLDNFSLYVMENLITEVSQLQYCNFYKCLLMKKSTVIKVLEKISPQDFAYIENKIKKNFILI